MRHILSKDEIEKKQKRNQIILGIIMIALMVASTAGYAFFSGNKSGNSQKSTYNGVKFTLNEDGLWHFKLGETEFATYNLPNEVKDNITININKNLADFNTNVLYFEANSDSQAAQNIMVNLGRFAGKVQFACLGNCDQDLPIKNCSDNIISIKNGNENVIREEDNCIFITSNDNILKSSDALIYRVLKII